MAHQSISQASGDHVHTVASHYNQLEEGGLEQRSLSRIYYLRNFNNWVKSLVIGDSLDQLRHSDRNCSIDVLDLCSGKGGDLLKWKKGRIRSLVCADIAGTSVEQSELRYRQNLERGRIYDAEFIVADCTKTRLKDKYKRRDKAFDLVSCQFSFHYCFESYPQAMMMLRNATECLKPGGYFIGTTPNSNEIVRRLREADGKSFGNDVYQITFEQGSKDHFPLFGARYYFHLEGVVDCPEFLVYFPVLEKMAAQFGMRLVKRKTFAQYFKDNIGRREHMNLLNNMQALEVYPPVEGSQPASPYGENYFIAEEFLSKLKEGRSSDFDPGKRITVGTLSKSEWEAATLYLVFVFQKVKDGPLSYHDGPSCIKQADSSSPPPSKHSEPAQSVPA